MGQTIVKTSGSGGMKALAVFALIGVSVTLNGCVSQKAETRAENTSVKHTVYVIESVKDIPSGTVFSFRDYCAFNAERGMEDADLDKTLALADARLELHFYEKTAELKLKSGIGYTGEAFLQYQAHYASRFLFTENQNEVELTLNLDHFDEETRLSIMAMPDAERNAFLKSVFEKSNGLLIEPDEEDDVINYWRMVR